MEPNLGQVLEEDVLVQEGLAQEEVLQEEGLVQKGLVAGLHAGVCLTDNQQQSQEVS